MKITREQVLQYEVCASWFAENIGNSFLQGLAAKYFSWKVSRKYARYVASKDREDWLNKTTIAGLRAGFELDKEVAVILGWNWDETRIYNSERKCARYRINGEDMLRSAIPYYSTNIEHAWEIVDYLKGRLSVSICIFSCGTAEVEIGRVLTRSTDPAMSLCLALLRLKNVGY